MKKFFKFLFISISFLFAGCENFMDGDMLKDSIDEKIQYEKSSAVTLRIESDNDAVKFLSGNSDISLKLKDKITIEFELDSSLYEFSGWKVYEKNKPDSNLSSCVKLSVSVKDNVYTTEITLLSNKANLVLCPQVSALPGVLNAEPKESVVICYRPIKVKFASPMNASDLSDFSNISIEGSDGSSLADYYSAPVLSDDGLELYISPNFSGSSSKQITSLVANGKIQKINVTLSSNIRERKERKTKFQGYSFSFSINNSEDLVPPSVTEFKVFRDIVDFADSNNKIVKKEITITNKDDIANSTILDCIVADSLFINCVASDNESGIKTLKVVETVLEDASGNTSSLVYNSSLEGSFSEISEKVFKADMVEYKLKSSAGIVRLDFSVCDYGNNEVPFTYFVVRYSEKANGDQDYYKPSIFKDKDADGKDVFFSGPLSIRDADENGIDTVTGSLGILSDQRLKCSSSRYLYVPAKISMQVEEDNTSKKIFDDWIVPPYYDEETKAYILKEFSFTRTESKKTTVKFAATDIFGKEYEYVSYVYPAEMEFKMNGVIIDSSVSSKYLRIPKEPMYYSLKTKNSDNYPTGNSINGNSIDLTSGYQYGTYKYVYYLLDENSTSVELDVKRIYFGTDSFIASCQNKSSVKVEYDYGNTKITSIKTSDSTVIKEEDYPAIKKIELTNMGEGTGLYELKVTFEDKPVKEGCFIGFGLFVEEDDGNTGALADYDLYNKPVQIGYSKYNYRIYAQYYDSFGFDCGSYIYPEEYKFKTEENNTGITLASTEPVLNDALVYGNMLWPRFSMIADLENYLEYSYDDTKYDYAIEYWYIQNDGVKERSDYTVENFSSLNLKKYEINSLVTHIHNPTGFFVVCKLMGLAVINSDVNDYFTVFARLRQTEKADPAKVKYSKLDKSSISLIVPESKIEYTSASTLEDKYIVLDYSNDITTSIDGGCMVLSKTGSKWDWVSAYETTGNSYAYYYGLTNGKVKIYVSDIAKTNFLKAFSNKVGYPVYLYYPYINGEITINRKDVFPGISGIQLYTDAPTLVETVYNKSNLASKELWETRGIPADVQIYDTDCYYSATANKVESGNWYAVLVHFADGTSWCSEAKYKK